MVRASDRALEGLLKDPDVVLKPNEIGVTEVIDLIDEEAWRLKLVLPRPEGDTWDREQVYLARRAATDLFDQLAYEEGRELAGSTLASVTTDEADESDIAEDEDPVEGEDPVRDR